ncbi:MAG: hypothetical protein WBB25_19855 [Sulfitobacter sp.]
MGKSELQFSDKREALDYINKNEWSFIGRKGLFRKYDRYEGSQFYTNSGSIDQEEYETRWCLKLFPDGYVTVHALKDTSGSLPTGGFGGNIWHSEGVRDHMKMLCDLVNEVLEKDGSPMWVKFKHSPSEYPMFSGSDPEPIAILKTPLEAIDYDKKREAGISERAQKLSHSWINLSPKR